MASWQVHVTADAARDFSAIAEYTVTTFGERQARIYETTLTSAMNALRSGPNVRGSVARDEILPGLRTLHVARMGRRGRHLILYRASAGQSIDVLRILHDAMDLARHIPSDD
jgi:toxin ParE1/3/4